MARECYWLARSGGLAKQGPEDISASTATGWNSETAHSAGARPCCREAHAEEYVSRWVWRCAAAAELRRLNLVSSHCYLGCPAEVIPLPSRMIRIWFAFTSVKRSIFPVVGHFTSTASADSALPRPKCNRRSL
jgi:hypothetical protein